MPHDIDTPSVSSLYFSVSYLKNSGRKTNGNAGPVSTEHTM
jgi:hypothetical protein